MLRLKSLSQLGKGAWKVASETPVSVANRLSWGKSPSPSISRSTAGKLASKGRKNEVTPHDILWGAISTRWNHGFVREFERAIPERRFRIDIAFPAIKLSIEVDGFQHHGKYLKDFKRDRERQNEFAIAGWTVLRFPAGDIRADVTSCVAIVARAIDALTKPDTVSSAAAEL